jgi:hypothetical protein
MVEEAGSHLLYLRARQSLAEKEFAVEADQSEAVPHEQIPIKTAAIPWGMEEPMTWLIARPRRAATSPTTDTESPTNTARTIGSEVRAD